MGKKAAVQECTAALFLARSNLSVLSKISYFYVESMHHAQFMNTIFVIDYN